MGVSAYAEKAMLDWVLGGATPTRPATQAVGLSLGTPSSVSASELAIAGYARQAVTFGAATSPGGFATNVNAFTFPVFSTTEPAVTGLQIWDTTAAGAGSMLAYGLMSSLASMRSGTDTLVFASAALTVLLS